MMQDTELITRKEQEAAELKKWKAVFAEPGSPDFPRPTNRFFAKTEAYTGHLGEARTPQDPVYWEAVIGELIAEIASKGNEAAKETLLAAPEFRRALREAVSAATVPESVTRAAEMILELLAQSQKRAAELGLEGKETPMRPHADEIKTNADKAAKAVLREAYAHAYVSLEAVQRAQLAKAAARQLLSRAEECLSARRSEVEKRAASRSSDASSLQRRAVDLEDRLNLLKRSVERRRKAGA